MSSPAPAAAQAQPDAWLASVGALLSAAADIAGVSLSARSLSDHPLSICLAFLESYERSRQCAFVSRQWNRVAAMPTSNADGVIPLQHLLCDTVMPSQGLHRWASQRAAGVSSAASAFPLLPSPPSVAFGAGTAHPNASSSINCLIAAHLGGDACHGSVTHYNRASQGPIALGPNPPYLSEFLGWPHLAATMRDGVRPFGIRSEMLQRRASFEGWCRIFPAHLQSLTICSPDAETRSLRDSPKLGGGDAEWIELLQTIARDFADASAKVVVPRGAKQQQPQRLGSEFDRQIRRAAANAMAAASAPPQFDPAKSPFPRLRSLTIHGSGLSWPVVQVLLRACPSIVHLNVPADASAECKATCAVLQSRGPDASVNDVPLSESRCSLCGEQAAPLLTCENESCALSGCGPCMLSTSDRHHFLCRSSRMHDGGGMLYCYATGPCDDHVCWQCPGCIGQFAGDSSPGECGACGCLACADHCAYGSCVHYPEVMYRCSRCRCRKCRYCCGEFGQDSPDEASDEEEEEEEDEEEEEEYAATRHRGMKQRKKVVTHWRHG